MSEKDICRRILVLGGARSGKSTYALGLAKTMFKRPLFVATAQPCDDEMAKRIDEHRKSRPAAWTCIEEPLDIAAVLTHPPDDCDGVLLDCLTVWAGNVLFLEGEESLRQRADALIGALKSITRDVLVVSNEVGLGIVPENRMGREFRDLAGRINQEVAAGCDTVVFMVAGLPMPLKGKI